MPQNMIPEFVCVGAEKSGTTWLSQILSENKEIFIPQEKELHYFNKKDNEYPTKNNYNYSKPFSWYASFFSNAKAHQLKGEVCPSYFWDLSAPKRISQANPDTKIIIVLRHPLYRTWSHYRYYYQKGIINEKSFEKALKKYPELIERSKYFNQIKRYKKLFEKVFIITMEDMMTNKRKTLRTIESFLGVAHQDKYSFNKVSNVTGVAKYRLFNMILTKTKIFLKQHKLSFLIELSRVSGISKALENIRNNSTKSFTKKPQMKIETKKRLTKIFSKEIKRISSYVDVSPWLN